MGDRKREKCVNPECGEFREIAADGLCFTCYRARARARERADDPYTAAERNERNKLKHHKKLRRVTNQIINAVEDGIDVFIPEDVDAIRRMMQPYILGLGRGLSPIDHPVNSEQEFEVNSSQNSSVVNISNQSGVNSSRNERNLRLGIESDVNGEQELEVNSSPSSHVVNISADLDVNSSHDESNLRHGIVIVNDTPRLTCSPANSDTSVHGSHGLPFIRNAEIIPVGESAVLYIANLCPDPEGWMEQLLTLPWSPERLKMYGKQLELKRETIHYGVAYDFNPESKPPLQWDDKVLILRDLLTETTGIEHEQCACNLYPDGMTNIGCHHDKQHPVSVTSASFGAYRQMGFRVGEGADVDRSLPLITLEPGSLLLFSGDFNTKYKHGLLTDKAVKEPRISITFRHFAEVMQE